MTLTELHDARLDVIAHARDTLERASGECRAWPGHPGHLLRVVAAIATLEGALRGVDDPARDKDETVRDCGWKTLQLVAIVEDRMGPEAAEYVSSGEGDSEDAA